MERVFNIAGWIIGIISFYILSVLIGEHFYDWGNQGVVVLSGWLAIGLGNIIHSRNFSPFSSSRLGQKGYMTLLVCGLLLCMTSFFVSLVIGPYFGTVVWIDLAMLAAGYFFAVSYVYDLPPFQGTEWNKFWGLDD